MASAVDLCNLALSHIGNEANIQAIDPPDGSAESDHCATFYAIARDEVLASHAWGFATKRVALALIEPDEQPGNWLYAYAVPSDCLQPISVLAPITTASPALTSYPMSSLPIVNTTANNDDRDNDFIMEVIADGSRVIYTNVCTAILRYVYTLTDTAKFSPLMRAALARLLASYLAGPVLKGEVGMKVAAGHLKQYMQIDLPRATAQDANAQVRNAYRDFIPAGIVARQ